MCVVHLSKRDTAEAGRRVRTAISIAGSIHLTAKAALVCEPILQIEVVRVHTLWVVAQMRGLVPWTRSVFAPVHRRDDVHVVLFALVAQLSIPLPFDRGVVSDHAALTAVRSAMGACGSPDGTDLVNQVGVLCHVSRLRPQVHHKREAFAGRKAERRDIHCGIDPNGKNKERS